eukprot:tig00000600_g2263.t1
MMQLTAEEVKKAIIVTNLSPDANGGTLVDLFSFCGTIKKIHLEHRQAACVVFSDVAAAETALLLSNAIIIDKPVKVMAYAAASEAANLFSSLPGGMGKGWIPADGKLELRDQGWTEWPAAEIAAAGPHNIRELNLSGNKLTRISGTELAKLTNLEKLYMMNNQLTALPPEIGCLVDLRALRVSGNQLAALPPEIGCLPALKELYVHKNPVVASWPEPVRRVVNGNATSYGEGDAQCAAVVPYLRSLPAHAAAPVPAAPPAPRPSFTSTASALAGPGPRLQLEAAAEQLAAAAERMKTEARAAALAEERAEGLAREREAALAEALTEAAALRERLAEAEAARLRAEERAAQAQAEAAAQRASKEQAEAFARVQAQATATAAAALRERLALYEGGSADGAPGGRPWGEAEIAAAAERLQAATRRVEELRVEARVAALARFECPVCLEKKARAERRLLHPCGHVVCAACVQPIASGDGKCPICRGTFGGSARLKRLPLAGSGSLVLVLQARGRPELRSSSRRPASPGSLAAPWSTQDHPAAQITEERYPSPLGLGL